MSGINRQVRVGYYLNAKKMRRSDSFDENGGKERVWRGGGLADLLLEENYAGPVKNSGSSSNSSSRGIGGEDSVCFEAFDAAEHFDVVIHKLTEDLMLEERGGRSDKLDDLRAYLSAHPGTLLLDPLESVRRVVSRARTQEGLRRVHQRLLADSRLRLASHHTDSGDGTFLGDPAYYVARDAAELGASLSRLDIAFPVICKPVEACGRPESHRMAVVLSTAGLALAPLPCVVTGYRDHCERLFKVYVLGEEVMVFRRRSLPDLADLLARPDARPGLLFDSRLDYPTRADFVDGPLLDDDERKEEGEESSRRNPPPEPCVDKFRAIAVAIQQEFGLELFGFDVICPSSSSSTAGRGVNNRSNHGGGAVEEGGTDTHAGADTREMLVVDVNFFPSYKEVHDFPARFRKMLRRKAMEKQQKQPPPPPSPLSFDPLAALWRFCSLEKSCTL